MRYRDLGQCTFHSQTTNTRMLDTTTAVCCIVPDSDLSFRRCPWLIISLGPWSGNPVPNSTSFDHSWKCRLSVTHNRPRTEYIVCLHHLSVDQPEKLTVPRRGSHPWRAMSIPRHISTLKACNLLLTQNYNLPTLRPYRRGFFLNTYTILETIDLKISSQDPIYISNDATLIDHSSGRRRPNGDCRHAASRRCLRCLPGE